MVLLCLLVAGPGSSLAQTNPTPEDCGLPAQGTILVSEVYTLDEDCTQTGNISINPNVSVTINGAGYTIRGSNAFTFSAPSSGITLNLNNLTIDNEGNANPNVIFAGSDTTFTATNVTFRGGSGVMLNIGGSANATLTKAHFDNNFSNARTNDPNNANAPGMTIAGSATVTMTDAVFYWHRMGVGAISVLGSGSLTANGCLSFGGNVPYDVFGTWTDNSTGACTSADEVGNGDRAVIPATELLPCGLPAAPGIFTESRTYTLNSNCDFSDLGGYAEWRISQDLQIRIQGNGRRLIGGSGDNFIGVYQGVGGTLTIEDLIVENVQFVPFGTGTVNVRRSAFTGNPAVFFYLVGIANIRNSVFEDTTLNSASALALLTDVTQRTESVAVFAKCEMQL